ncbi:2-oxo acid dehydrogenase subunit E2 [Planococcus shenhongbingii]|uniref:dihydrolipoamide acetyltransferase family protein n=1 Tax=Planococcus shenhongbingii TaxID=3058398 RepID=UPI00261C8A05|nr:2-oxo acid dehydrogenase subunit E2 [Planococcus sp. N016]WKA59474.1 2-oxo acid dehydrogenase subunit E2 [Planococcus sp. N016]
MIEVKLPKIREDVDESLVVIWFVSEGDAVKKGDPLLEIQTEKEVSEIEAETSGIIKKIVFKRGESAKIGEVLATIDPTGKIQETKPEEQRMVEKVEPEKSAETENQKPEEQKTTETAENQETATEQKEPAKAMRLAPGLRKLARELNVPLESVAGTGRNGKITEKDIRRVAGQTEVMDAAEKTKESQQEMPKGEPPMEEPSTEEPATEEASTEEPATEEASTEEPATEEASTEEPATEEASTEEPATEEALTEEPATEEALTEEPATEEALTEEAVEAVAVQEETSKEESSMEEQAAAMPEDEALQETAPKESETENSSTSDQEESSGENEDETLQNEVIPLSGIRGAIARRMTESLQNSAQLTETAWADITKLEARKDSLGKEAGWTALIAKAVAQTLGEHPALNAHIIENQIIPKRKIHLGFAVDSENGLQVAVLQNADKHSPAKLQKRLSKLAEKAREGKLSSEESTGSTFTISSLGSYRVQFFTPIINPPEAAILGIGQIENYLVMEDGKVQERKRLPLSLTIDHRAVDGAPAAKFLGDLIEVLERPKRFLKDEKKKKEKEEKKKKKNS